MTVQPIILDLTGKTPLSIEGKSTNGTVDLIIPSTRPLTEAEWDVLDEAVKVIEGLPKEERSDEDGEDEEMDEDDDEDEKSEGGRIIVICKSSCRYVPFVSAFYRVCRRSSHR